MWTAALDRSGESVEPGAVVRAMLRMVAGFLRRGAGDAAAPRQKRSAYRRVRLAAEPAAIYAIGDVHGHLGHLRRLEALIEADARAFPGSKLIVTLGDYVDRGSDSAAVIDHLVAPPPLGLERLCLLGNHEQLMLELLRDRIDVRTWMDFGGEATMRSYGIDFHYLTAEAGMTAARAVDLFREAVPAGHVDFLAALPIAVETPRHIFVHAGVRPSVAWEDQADEDLLYIRNDFLLGDLSGFPKTVVHGHTPGMATVSERRISLDSGVHLGGPLTAARITADGVRLLEAR